MLCTVGQSTQLFEAPYPTKFDKDFWSIHLPLINAAALPLAKDAGVRATTTKGRGCGRNLCSGAGEVKLRQISKRKSIFGLSTYRLSRA